MSDDLFFLISPFVSFRVSSASALSPQHAAAAAQDGQDGARGEHGGVGAVDSEHQRAVRRPERLSRRGRQPHHHPRHDQLRRRQLMCTQPAQHEPASQGGLIDIFVARIIAEQEVRPV